MKKRLIFAGLVIFFTLIFLQFFLNPPLKLTSNAINENYHSFTKAICNQSYCQDYEILCRGKNIISQTPITGAVIEIPNGWIDPRNESERNIICN